MSVGIKSYGAYIPLYRMSLAELSRMWGGPERPGEKAVANYDEDSLTMGVEAAVDCLSGMDRQSVDGLFFATMSPPYKEKQNASIIARALDLRPDIVTADIADSMRGGSTAVRLGLDVINAGSAKNFLVTAADRRTPPPDSDLERAFGDGAAALLLGDSDIAVEIEGVHGLFSDFIDTWRREEDTYPHTWEDRFVIEKGYFDHLGEGIAGLFKKYNVTAKDFNKVVYYAYDVRRHGELARRLGFDLKTQVQDPLLSVIGNTGTASAMMMLVAALEDAKAGDRILFATYGDGVDVFMLRVTDQIEKIRERRAIKRHLASKSMLTYGKYIHYRGLMEWKYRIAAPNYASVAMSWRDHNWVVSLKGGKCKKCGKVQIPPQRVCAWCQAKDEIEEVRLSDKKGTMYTYSADYLSEISPDPPNVIAVIDIEGGGRLSTTLTDRDPDKLAFDLPMEFTFRNLHDSQGVKNYFWRARPIRA